MKPRLSPAWLLVALLLAGGVEAGAQEPPGVSLPVHEIRLANGMRLLALSRPGAPTVAFVVQYTVGGVNERLGTTGVAHLLEHMLFKGTTTVGTRGLEAELALFERMDALHDSLIAVRAAPRPDTAEAARMRATILALEDSAQAFVEPNELDRILSRQGARGLNASTSAEATTYYVELPANRVELWFALEADRMRNPVFREFYAERDVVMEERRMRVEDSGAGRLHEAHLATAYLLHPYGVPVVGWMSDLETLTRGAVEEYYRRFYGPNNAVVAIVGDIDPERISTLARAYFGSIERGEAPPPVTAREPVQRGERRVTVEFDAGAAVRIGWHVPETLHEDSAPLVMLSSLLSGGRTSRLFRRLVLEERVAAQLFTAIGPGNRYPRLFQVDAIPRAPHAPTDVEALVYEELELLALTPPTEDELARVRSQVEAADVRRLQSNLGLAFQLADSDALFGDWRETFRQNGRLRDVTPEDVQRVVQRYFTPSNRTVATLARPAAAASPEGP